MQHQVRRDLICVMHTAVTALIPDKRLLCKQRGAACSCRIVWTTAQALIGPAGRAWIRICESQWSRTLLNQFVYCHCAGCMQLLGARWSRKSIKRFQPIETCHVRIHTSQSASTEESTNTSTRKNLF